MKLLQLASLFGAALAVPADLDSRQTCTTPKLRKNWAAATTAEKTAYLNAAVCVTKKPSRLGLANATLHDDFAYVHAILYQQSQSPQPQHLPSPTNTTPSPRRPRLPPLAPLLRDCL